MENTPRLGAQRPPTPEDADAAMGEFARTIVVQGMSLDAIIADIDARGWCYEIDNFHPSSERRFGDRGEIRRADVGVNIYTQGAASEWEQLANVFGHGSLAEAIRAAYDAATAADDHP